MKKLFLILLFFVSACETTSSRRTHYEVEVRDIPYVGPNTKALYPKMPVRTSENVSKFSLDLPYRCDVDWEMQRVVKTEPFDRDHFEIANISKGDELPLFMINGFSIDSEPVDVAFRKLFDKTGIKVKGLDPIYPVVSLPETDGMVDVVLDMISELSQVYYSYDKKTETIYLSRNAKFEVSVPLSEDAILAVLDSMYGAGIDGIVTDWEDKVLRFNGNKITEKEVKNLIKQMGEEKTLIAYDINVYRINPKGSDGLKWMELLRAFKAGTVKSENSGMIGKLLVVDNNLSPRSLEEFIKQRADMQLLSSGSFVIPNRWQGRFDIGSCSKMNTLEENLFVMAQAKYENNIWRKDHLDSKFFLKGKDGDITSFDVMGRLGENYLIIGIPTHYFVEEDATTISPNSELVMFVSPRIINIVDMREVDE
ncbi:MAG: hypothetical protein LBR35_01420 [Rickettsiales bacterium]|jgi:hypothetical protein|nr:hypothetical protein [Rickettsiales bacterium]